MRTSDPCLLCVTRTSASGRCFRHCIFIWYFIILSACTFTNFTQTGYKKISRVQSISDMRKRFQAVLLESTSRLSFFLKVSVYYRCVDVCDPGCKLSPQSWAPLHLKDDLLSGQLWILLHKDLETPPSYSVLSLLHLLCSPSPSSQMCASKCVTDPPVYSQPSSRRLSSWASLSFATAALMACQLCHACPDTYCMCTVIHMQRKEKYT